MLELLETSIRKRLFNIVEQVHQRAKEQSEREISVSCSYSIMARVTRRHRSEEGAFSFFINYLHEKYVT